MGSKVGFADSLGKNVVSAGICAGCGACVAACPNGCLRWGKERPDLQERTSCGFCARVCPGMTCRCLSLSLSFLAERENPRNSLEYIVGPT